MSPLLIIEQIVAIQADVMKTMAAQHAAILAVERRDHARAVSPGAARYAAAELRNAGSGKSDEDR